MKKQLLISALGLATLSPLTQADTILGVYAGIGTWNPEYSGDIGRSDLDIEDLGFDDDDWPDHSGEDLPPMLAFYYERCRVHGVPPNPHVSFWG